MHNKELLMSKRTIDLEGKVMGEERNRLQPVQL